MIRSMVAKNNYFDCSSITVVPLCPQSRYQLNMIRSCQSQMGLDTPTLALIRGKGFGGPSLSDMYGSCSTSFGDFGSHGIIIPDCCCSCRRWR